MNPCETAALDYAARGWPVLPLHSAKDGRCTCGKVDCDSPAKHPRTLHGLKDATTDPKTIEAWWRTWPDANVGIVTGAPSGLIVVDVDPRHGGDATLDDLLAAHEQLPETPESLTGGGGRHIFFRYPGGTVRSGNGKLGPGLDLKGDSGYIVAPPSVHVSGKRYQWELSSEVGEVPLADAPAWLLAQLAQLQDPPAPAAGAPQGGRIVDGQRNTTLASLAGSMRRRGMTAAAILAALQADNRARCDPPLPYGEVAAIAKSIGRYPPAVAAPEVDGPVLTGAARCTDTANAARFVAQAGEDFRWVGAWGKWLRWSGGCWRPDDALAVLKRAKRVVGSIFTECRSETDDRTRGLLAKWAVQSLRAERLKAMIDLARPELAVSPDDLDRDPMLLNVDNGTVDLRTGERRPHARGDLITKQAPVAFDPRADCPLWRRFLTRIMDGRATMIGFLQRLSGMCLTGDVRDQHLFIFFGPGANGKSVYLDTTTGLLGDYATQAPPDLLVVKRHSEHPTEIADLCGRRFVVSTECEEGSRLKVQLVKRLTGDRRLKARFMRADFFEFTRTHKIVLVTNNRPQVREASLAVWRRVCLVPFTVVIPPGEQDLELIDKLRAEWPGILNWALTGCREWLAYGLQAPPEVLQATEEYQAEQDVLADFVDECCILAANAVVARGDIYRAYEAWAKRSGESHPLINRQLYERLRNLPGVSDDDPRRVKGKVTRLFRGIGLLSVPSEVCP
jgi:putative DNA primase/helicase